MYAYLSCNEAAGPALRRRSGKTFLRFLGTGWQGSGVARGVGGAGRPEGAWARENCAERACTAASSAPWLTLLLWPVACAKQCGWGCAVSGQPPLAGGGFGGAHSVLLRDGGSVILLEADATKSMDVLPSTF